MSELLRPRGAPLVENPAAALNADARWRLTQLEQRLVPADSEIQGCVTGCTTAATGAVAQTGRWYPWAGAITMGFLLVSIDMTPAATTDVIVSARKNGVAVAVVTVPTGAKTGRVACDVLFTPNDYLTFTIDAAPPNTILSRLGVTLLTAQALFTGPASGGLIFNIPPLGN